MATIPIPPSQRQWPSDMRFFGPDFAAARQHPLYTAESGQHPLLVIAFAVLLFVIYSILQILCGGFAHVLLFGGMPWATGTDTAAMGNFLKAVVIGILPASLIAVAVALFVAGLWNKTGDRGIPLRLPDLGIGGWFVLILAFVVSMYLIFVLVFVVTGIDPSAYTPSSQGLNDSSSSAGMMEKTIADLADEPLLFALAFPAVVAGAPLVEEFVFRGALFSALRQTWLKAPGTLVVTSAAWALVHGSAAPWLFVLLLFFMGLVLGGALLRFGSIWVPVILHAVWNCIVSLAMLSGLGMQ
ncbi:MAG: CPBP family intramembrane metalloprotease [Proteobacteria bacterium]|nr:CPBP family intramembrane metalloprotease [Pseudomonadota bacterium]